MNRKATLDISDMHFGDSAQLYGTLQECMERAIVMVRDFAPLETEVVLNGDAVAGRGIFRGQAMQNALQLGSEQAWWAAHEIQQWQHGLRASRWIIILGNHDNSERENLAAQLAMCLQMLGVNAYYAGRSYTGNFSADERDDSWYEAEHGFGGSDYYANSYTEIRAMWRKYVERACIDDIHLSRVLLGHTHWLNIGQAAGIKYAIDTTGGWHRQERLKLAGDTRDTGMILYLHDGQNLRVQDVRSDAKLLIEETRDPALHYKTMRAASDALLAVTKWGHERGLC